MTQEEAPNPARVFNSVSAEEFIKQRDMLESDLFAFLTPHTGIDYCDKNTRLFLSEDSQSGFGINPDGELISVFALERSRGKILVAEAKKQGAKYLSCMGDHLLKMYSEFDFSPVEILKWDNQFAPKNWNYERFGTPNIYDMKLINPYTRKFEK
ncbi:MAG: hypothetical protein WAV29_01320 [Microgenomates group bacterium]